MELLEKTLMRVPWSSLLCCGGNCEKVPQAIVGLAAGNKATRKESYWGIDNVVIVQGGLHQGALFVVPFLLQILKDQSRATVELYDLLFEIANGISASDSRVSYSVREVPFVFYEPKLGGIEEPEEPLCCACRSAVLRGWSLFVRDLEHGEVEVRVKALDLVTCFKEHRYMLQSLIKNLRERETNLAFLEQLSSAINELNR